MANKYANAKKARNQGFDLADCSELNSRLYEKI